MAWLSYIVKKYCTGVFNMFNKKLVQCFDDRSNFCSDKILHRDLISQKSSINSKFNTIFADLPSALGAGHFGGAGVLCSGVWASRRHPPPPTSPTSAWAPLERERSSGQLYHNLYWKAKKETSDFMHFLHMRDWCNILMDYSKRNSR